MQVNKVALLLIASMLLVLFCFSNAFAHKSNIHAKLEDGKVHVKCYFSKNDPMKNSKIKITDEKGNTLAEGKTDGKGEFIFDLPENVEKIKIVVIDLLGHKGEATFSKDDLVKHDDHDHDHH